MKDLIFIVAILSILTTGCSNTTYVSLSESNREQIEEHLNYDEQDEGVGVEVKLSLKNGTEVNGELLSVRDNTLIICKEYSATEGELANRTYPINTIQNNEIKELIIEGDSYIWAGIGYGALGGALIAAVVGYAIAVEEKSFGVEILGGGLIGFIVGAFAGGVVGNANSTNDIILSGIPADYDLSILKPLARYPDEEPEYLKVIE